MHFRAVADRCAVDMRQLRLPVSDALALQILESAGFSLLEVDVVQVAWELLGNSYRRGARLSEAPDVFDCSSFIKYVYGMRGIWLPRRSIQQRRCGINVGIEEVLGGDLIFCSGHIDYFDSDPDDGVGHVGIATDAGTVIHAANRHLGVVEVPRQAFLGQPEHFRGAKRIVPRTARIVTLQAPQGRELEISDDIRWIVLQQMS
jgi:cell wall-associated NlpC family hydrolase